MLPTSPASPTTALFVYGTLMAPPVRQLLLEGITAADTSKDNDNDNENNNDNDWPLATPALLRGYQRYPVRQQRFPAVMRSHNHSVHGLYLSHISPQQLRIFDYFEDTEYRRQDVTVQLLSSHNKLVPCQVYEWINPISDLQLEATWDFDVFCRDHLDSYVEQVVRPCVVELERLGYYEHDREKEDK